MAERITAPSFASKKARGERIVMVTAYDSTFAEIADEAGFDAILVGDSLGNVVLGYPSTIPVTLADMTHHVRAVRTGVRRSLLIADLPFGSYQSGVSSAVDSAVTLMKAGADAVKLEGNYFDEIAAIHKAGIPVMGHFGFTPQSIHQFGGHKVQGRGSQADAILAATQSAEQVGIFGLVLELIPSELARVITDSLLVPTIGIGAGVNCDGQVQVINDILGLGTVRYKHAGQFLDGRNLVRDALMNYRDAVSKAEFPTESNSF